MALPGILAEPPAGGQHPALAMLAVPVPVAMFVIVIVLVSVVVTSSVDRIGFQPPAEEDV